MGKGTTNYPTVVTPRGISCLWGSHTFGRVGYFTDVTSVGARMARVCSLQLQFFSRLLSFPSFSFSFHFFSHKPIHKPCSVPSIVLLTGHHPRCDCLHTHTSFSVGVRNSFPDKIMELQFYQKYYQLLLFNQFNLKVKKLMLVGPPDSGKTSWFAPFQGRWRTSGQYLIPLHRGTSAVQPLTGVVFKCAEMYLK